MPPASPPPNPKGAKGKAGFLTKKIGPFSTWVWLVMVGGSVAVWFMLRRSSGSGGGPVELVTGADGGGGVATPQDAAGAGMPSQNGAPGMQMDPAVLEQLQSMGSDIGNMARAFGTATGSWEAAAGEIGDMRQMFEDAAYQQYADTGMGYGSTPASSVTVAATLGAPGARPAQKQSIMWGGTIYGAKTGDVFIQEQLRPKGVNPQSWAKKHPAAAAYLGIPKSAPKPPKHVARPAPKKVVAKKAPVRAPAKAKAVTRAKVAAPKKKPVKKKVRR